jgi:RimJ/RimL family protein N-acetyltransferase
VYWLASRDYEFGDDYRMLSIDFDGFPVGFMGYGVNNDKIYIEPMMVDTMFQRKGIASKALALFEEKIRTETQYRIITIGNRTDNTAADRTYEKAGYVLLKTDGLSRYREKLL